MDYLPPETARDGSADDRSDLYGLGAILYLALSGRPPYHGPPGEEQGERLLRVLSTPVPPLHRADVPPELAGLVSALLAKDPDARPADAATMAARLRALREAAAPTDDPAEGAAAGQGPAEDQAAPSAFDDFAAAGTPAATPSNRAAPSNAAAPSSPAAPRPQGEPILVFGPKQPRRATRTALVSAAAGALAMLAVVAVVLLLQQPDELAVSPTPPSIGVTNPSATPSQVVRLELSDPVDQGSFVQLSWRSSEPLDYAVVVAAQGEEAKVLFAQRATTYRVPVDPVRAYCFLIQGTNANQAYESQAKPIRGATCAK